MNEALFTSTSVEWYTPEDIISDVIRVMGGIDVDPCSPYHDGPVPATVHYTKAEDGLSLPWNGRVFMNPPYGHAVLKWSMKLVFEYLEGRTKEAIVLTNSSTETRWFNQLSKVSGLWCAPIQRIKFVPGENNPKENRPTKGNAIFYFGKNSERFIDVFSEWGPIYRVVTT